MGEKRPQYRIVAKIIPRGIVVGTTPQYYPRPNRLQIRKFRIVAQIIPRGIVGETTPQHYPRPNRLQIRKFRIVARLPRVRPRQKLEL